MNLRFLKKTTLILATFLFVPSIARSDELSELKTNFEAAYSKTTQSVTELNNSYSEALERLFQKITADGNLNDALLVKNEYEKFGDGSGFHEVIFADRATELSELESLRNTYLSSRKKRFAQIQRQIDGLLDKYRIALTLIEQRETKNQNLKMALEARTMREDLSKDPRFSNVEVVCSASVHFVVKGDIKIRLNDEKLSFRNRTSNPQYVSGITRPVDMKPDDILFLEVEANSVFRSMIVAIESEDTTRVLPFKAADFIYLGEEAKTDKLQVSDLHRVNDRAESGSADANMQELWDDHKILPAGKAECQWALVSENGKWLTYALIVGPAILEP